MIGIRATVSLRGGELLQRLERLQAQAPRLVEEAVEFGARIVRLDLLNFLEQEPGPPQYPLRWASEKQRRAFFATNGFGKGIPYRRTGQLAQGWTVTVEQARARTTLTLANPAGAARYVYGPQQQPFHADTGWHEILQRDGERTATVAAFDQRIIDEIEGAYLDIIEDYVRGAS